MKNIILADCEREEIASFCDGVQDVIGEPFLVESKICNTSHTGINEIKRYLAYATFPLRYVKHNDDYSYIIAWQQFFALFYAFYCRILHKKKKAILVAGNFTYKQKQGIAGKLYFRFFKLCLASDYIDYIHVPSQSYADEASRMFGVPIEKFIVAGFGIDDGYSFWKNRKSKYKNVDYTFSIGRSNRDFDFLLDVWDYMPEDKRLIIASDTYSPSRELPPNVKVRNDVAGWHQYPLIVNCTNMVIPIKDGSICSGDTVLLKAMSFERPVVVTAPSTLAEMYITDAHDGICCEKDPKLFAQKIMELYENNSLSTEIGKNARQTFLDNYSRRRMGINIGNKIIQKRG